ncbi:MAG: ABC transporter permease, partial [Terriglobales bacterium]
MKLLTVIKRELLARVRTRGFIIFTVLIPVLGGGFLFMEYAIISASNRVATSVAVVDLSHQVYPALDQVLATHTANGKPLYSLTSVEATSATDAVVEERLRAAVLAKKYDSYLVIPADVMTTRKATFHVRNAANFTAAMTLQDALRSAINRVHMAAAGMPAGEIQAMSADVDLSQIKVSATGDKSDNS